MCVSIPLYTCHVIQTILQTVECHQVRLYSSMLYFPGGVLQSPPLPCQNKKERHRWPNRDGPTSPALIQWHQQPPPQGPTCLLPPWLVGCKCPGVRESHLWGLLWYDILYLQTGASLILPHTPLYEAPRVLRAPRPTKPWDDGGWLLVAASNKDYCFSCKKYIWRKLRCSLSSDKEVPAHPWAGGGGICLQASTQPGRLPTQLRSWLSYNFLDPQHLWVFWIWILGFGNSFLALGACTEAGWLNMPCGIL